MINFVKKLFSQEGQEKDLVCGMMVSTKTAKYKSELKNKICYFCSDHCKKQFDENPQRYSS